MSKHALKLPIIFKYGGVVAVFFEWVAAISFYLIAPEYFDGAHPLSYFASLLKTRTVFILCYILATTSFFLFVFGYLRKKRSTPTLIFFSSMVFAVASTLFPYDPAVPFIKSTHDLLVRLANIAFISGVLIMALKERVLEFRTRGVTIVLFSVLSSIAVAILDYRQGVLVAEAFTFIALQYWTLWMTFRTK